MKKSSISKGSLAAVILVMFITHFSGCVREDLLCKDKEKEYVLVGNRNAGNVSIIDAVTNSVIDSIVVRGQVKGEPMYIVYGNNRIFVGDRANNNVHVYNAFTRSEIGTIPCGKGVFHMWADPKGKQLWVNNDIDNTITVIDMNALKVKTTISIGQQPHDIILSADGNYAFVTIFSGIPKIPDSIFKYSTNDFLIKAKAAVGKDPHVCLTSAVYSLYVPCQGAGSVFVLQQGDLSLIKNIAVPNAHGAYMSPNGKTFYTSNIAGGGIDGLWSISTLTNQVIGSPANTNNPTPHNIVINGDGTKLFLTHSGATSKVISVYKISAANPQPVYVTTLTTDLNPFGIAYYKSKK